MKVWIDQNWCTGAGTCEQIAPAVFERRGDGLWAVSEDADHFGTTTVFDGESGEGHAPDGANGLARVPAELEDDVIDAAEKCPADGIYVEV